MNTPKERKMFKIREATVSSRAKERASRTTTVVTETKAKTHGGMKFNLNQKFKTTVPKPFSFDSGPKIKKGSPCSLSLERSPAKQTNGETKEKGTRNELKIATEFLRTPKETQNCRKTKSVSRERTQNSATKLDTTQKTTCRRSMSAKPLAQPSKAGNSSAPTPKAVKSVASNARQSRGKATKTGAQPSKSQVHFSDTQKSEAKVKGCGFSSVSSSKSEISTTKVTSHTSNAVITDQSLQNELKTKLRIEHPNEDNSKPASSNGFVINLEYDSSEAESPNEINLQSELESAIQNFESDMSKNASKIPRKKCAAHSGMKFQANFKEETISEQIDFESRSSNYKMENTKSQVNHVQITNLVNN